MEVAGNSSANGACKEGTLSAVSRDEKQHKKRARPRKRDSMF